MIQKNPEYSENGGKKCLRHIFLVALAGAYTNIVAYGFSFSVGNQAFELPMLNWMRNPSLYPQDPIRDAFPRFPTIFWPVVAHFSQSISTEKLLLLFFVPTKILFFLALTAILKTRVRNTGLLACIIVLIALSPAMNDLTPLGASDILDSAQTHTSVGIALLLCSVYLLLNERWVAAAIICAFTVYVSALFFIFMLFAFAIFAVFDWRRHQKEIAMAGLLGAMISVPWLLIFRGIGYRQFPDGYVEALVAFYPFQSTLRGHEGYDLLTSFGLIVAAALMVLIARASSQRRDFRFEVLTLSSLLPVLLGFLLAWIHLTPMIARLQLLRGDSFLMLYSILLVQFYGANLLGNSHRGPATTFLLGVTAMLLPLSEYLGLLWWTFIAMALWADPKERFEKTVRSAIHTQFTRFMTLGLLLAGMILAWSRHADWSLDVILLLAILMGCLFVSTSQDPSPADAVKKVAVMLVGATCLLAAMTQVPTISRLWNPVVTPTPLESDWRGLQEWAKANTERNAQFLVPTYPCGFRVFSERSSWGEWQDGQVLYLYPPFTEVYRQRMLAVGYSWQKWTGTDSMTENYKHLSWEWLLAVARQNHLSYIIQFRDVAYPVSPLFVNQHYAIYKAEF